MLNRYNENKDALIRQVITSFTGYIIKYLYDALERDNQPRKPNILQAIVIGDSLDHRHHL